ncbi:Ada metal-binding domain-containing protein [Streptomyces scopuliridis]|uniref:Ada metal-binding domain-containing protein n=1 Tax=Streptomyces scopuliridis TaxID=452529 RepID=UPI0036B27194
MTARTADQHTYTYTLRGPDNKPYRSRTPGTLGGHRRGKLYGRLDCPSALRAIARSHYRRHRVFFADESAAIAAGYRPCAVCLPAQYQRWKAGPQESEEQHVMNPLSGVNESVSPLVDPAELAGLGDLPVPAAHTDAELAALFGLLTQPRSCIASLAIGHSRDAASRASAEAFAAAWQAAGKDVLAIVDWPEHAASWLRPAQRLTAQAPDAWLIAAAPLGFAQLARRLRHSTDWDPRRTYAFAALGDSRVPALAGAHTLHGLRGATADGGTWHINRDWVTQLLPGDSESR